MRLLSVLCAVVLGTAMSLVGISARAAPLFDFTGPDDDLVDAIFLPNPFSGFSDTLGYTFSVSGSSIPIDGIGIFDLEGDGLGSTHNLALWDASDPSTPLVTAMVNPGASSNTEPSASGIGNYIYVDASWILEPGKTYTLGASYGPGASNMDEVVAKPLLPIIVNSANASYGEGVFSFGMGSDIVFPASPAGGNNYFGPTLRIAGTVSIPEPMTLALLGIGVLGLGIGRRVDA